MLSGISVSFSGAAGNQFGKDVFIINMSFVAAEQFLVVFEEVQRKLNTRRAKSIANYIEKGIIYNNFCFLSAITATCRGDIQFNQAANLVSIPFSTKLSVNDGQHRLSGIKIALEKQRNLVKKATGYEKQVAEANLKRLEEMTIPVVIFSGIDEKQEQQLFHDLNLLANKPTKSVSLKFDHTDLFNSMARDLAKQNEWLANYKIHMERTSLSEKNEELMVLSTLRNTIEYIITPTPTPLSIENYEQWKRELSSLFDLLFESLPQDCTDRSKYIIGLAATIQGIGKYIGYLISNPSITNVDEYIMGLGNVDWRHENNQWIGAGGSYDPTKNRYVFSGTGGGINGIFNKLIEINKPVL